MAQKNKGSMNWKIYVAIYIIVSVASLGLINLLMYISGLTPKAHLKFVRELLK